VSGRVTLGLVLLGAGVLGLLWATDAVDLDYTTWVGIALVGIGLAIALTRGQHGLLVVLGILVALAGIPALLVDDHLLDGGIGDSVEEPRSGAELDEFRHAIGQLTVDLTTPGLDLDGETVTASVGIGELLVLVGDDTDVSLDAHVGVGHIGVPGREEDGVDVDLEWISGTSGSQEVELDLEVGVGNIRVELR
jgi:Cell wall-active antibiotics response 4TMS YvqF